MVVAKNHSEIGDLYTIIYYVVHVVATSFKLMNFFKRNMLLLFQKNNNELSSGQSLNQQTNLK